MEAVTQTHDLTRILLDLLIFFGIAGIAVPALQRLRLSPVLGYLVSGLLIGALRGESASGITDLPTAKLLGELGVIALMFVIGLDLSFDRLRELKHYVLGLGGAQIVLTAALICAVALGFGNSPQFSILIGASLALSSTAIVMQLLNERHMVNRPAGTLSFSILLMQDLAVAPILVLVEAFAGGGDAPVGWALLRALLLAALSVGGIYLLGKRLLRPLTRCLSIARNPEWLVSMTLFLIVAAAALTHAAGLSAALGAFLAGLLIAETEYRHEIAVILAPVKNLLLGIFFLSVGMMIDAGEVVRQPFWLLISVVGIFLLKASVLFPLCLVFRVPAAQAAEVSVMLAQGGEFAFVVLGLALTAGLLPPESAQFFFLVTALSLLLAPLTFRLAPAAARLAQRWRANETAGVAEMDEAAPRRVLIAGYGRVGMLLGAVLEGQRIAHLAIENDAGRVFQLNGQGYPVIYGDAGHKELWRKLGAANAAAVVITIDRHDEAEKILRLLRREWPLLPVFVRARDADAGASFYALGATSVVPELLESSLQLARLLLESMQVESGEIDAALQTIRDQAALGEGR